MKETGKISKAVIKRLPRYRRYLEDLMKNFTYLGLDGCRIRNGYHFDNNGQHIAYHRTLPYSTITEEIDGVTYDFDAQGYATAQQ